MSMLIMFRPWVSIVLISAAFAFIAASIVDIKRRQQRGEAGWTTGHKVGITSMCLLIFSQALLLI